MMLPQSPIRRKGFILYRPGGTPSRAGDFLIPREEVFSFLFADASDREIVVGDSQNAHYISTVNYLKLSSFMYALTNITSLAVPFILKDALHLSPVHLGLFGALCATPSFIKPICTLVIARSARPLTLAVCASTQSVMYLTVGLAVAHGLASIPVVCGCMFVHSVASAVGMVLRDTMMVESAAGLNSDFQAHALFADVSMISRFGLLPVSYLSGYLLSYVSPAAVIGAAAICPAIVSLAALCLDRTGSSEEVNAEESGRMLVMALERIKDTDSGLFSTTTGRGLFLSLVPSYADAMFFYYTQAAGFSPEFLGRFQLLGAIAGIVGNGLSKLSAEIVDPQTVSNVAVAVSVPMYFSLLLLTTNSVQSALHMSTSVFVLTRHFLVDFLASLTALPSAVQLMRTAPKGAEGTYLALVGSISDFGGILNSLVSSATMGLFGITATSFSNLSPFLVLCNSLTAVTSPLLFYYNPSPKPTIPLMQELLEKEPKLRLEVASPIRDA